MQRRDFLRNLATGGGFALCQAIGLSSFVGVTTLVAPQTASADNTLRLLNPRLGTPVFTEPGETFNIEVKASTRLDPRGWKVVLRTDLGSGWTCSVADTSTTGINYDRDEGWRLIVNVPASITPELMTLEVSHRDVATKISEVRAVSIVPYLESDFYLFHLTDEHVMWNSHKHYANTDPRSGRRSADLVRWAMPVINLLNPRLVINSGDQAHQYATTGYRYSYENDIYRCYLDAKRGYHVPCMMLLGNHEVNEKDEGQRQRDWSRWESLAGRRVYHIRMGSMRFFAHDYLDGENRGFIDRLYRASFREPGVEGRVFVQHHTSRYGYHPSSEYSPTMMLIGHFHQQQVVDRYPYPILMSAAAHTYATGSILNFERHNGRWVSNAADHWNACAMRLVGDYGAPQAAVNYKQPNDGRSRSNQIVVRNDLNQSFGDGRIRLILQEGRYDVHGGDILSQTRLAGGKTAVLVRLAIPRNSSLEIEAVQNTRSTYIVGQPPSDAPDDVPSETVLLDETGAPFGILANTSDVRSAGLLAPLDPGAMPDQPEQTFVPMISQ